MDNDRLLARGKQVKFRISANGVSLVFPRVVAFAGGNMGKRGTVKGFSRASARRLRHLLMRVDYSNASAVTLTHPPVLDGMRGPESAFDSLRMVSKRFPWLRSLIWRKEVQVNGTPHFHCILFPVEGVDVLEASEKLVDDWIRQCLVGFDLPSMFVDRVAADMHKAHSDKRKPSIQILDGSRYLRYILDHESKHKREQAQTEGRAWGVWHRSRLPLVIPEEWDLEEEELWIVRRILRRATRYALKADCVFDWKHSRGRLGQAGVVDYFARCNDGSLGRRLLDYLNSGAFLPWSDPLDNAGRWFRRKFEHSENI